MTAATAAARRFTPPPVSCSMHQAVQNANTVVGELATDNSKRCQIAAECEISLPLSAACQMQVESIIRPLLVETSSWETLSAGSRIAESRRRTETGHLLRTESKRRAFR